MDLDEFRAILGNYEVGIWGFIETAIKVASLDYGDELIVHRDGIVAKLYANCPNCDSETRVRTSSGNGFVSNTVAEAVFRDDEEGHNQVNSPYIPVSIGGNDVKEEQEEEEEEGHNQGSSPYIPVSIGGIDVKEEEEEEEELGHNQGSSPYIPVSVCGNDFKEEEQSFIDEEDVEDAYDEERRIIISIKEQIEDPHKSEDSLIDLLQTLADMDITFKALQETDIGRHVNRLRKHPSNDIKRLVKLLVRKWKDLVDDWVRSNSPSEVQPPTDLIDGYSPQPNVPKHQSNGYHTQVPDFGYSPNPHNGSYSSDKLEYKPKPVLARGPPPQRDLPAKPIKTASPASAPPTNKQKQVAVERLASARKRLQENYQEAQNAKKQRTIQVMDIHELPKGGKGKNSFFGRNKGGFQRH